MFPNRESTSFKTAISPKSRLQQNFKRMASDWSKLLWLPSLYLPKPQCSYLMLRSNAKVAICQILIQLQTVFVQISKFICPNWQTYFCLENQNVVIWGKNLTGKRRSVRNYSRPRSSRRSHLARGSSSSSLSEELSLSQSSMDSWFHWWSQNVFT